MSRVQLMLMHRQHTLHRICEIAIMMLSHAGHGHTPWF